MRISRDQSPTDLTRSYNGRLTPGPGQYENKLSLKPRTTQSFSRERRMKSIPDTPGPCTYQNNMLSFLENAPNFGFGTEIRIRTQDSSTPAPGRYDTNKSTMEKYGGLISKNGRCKTESNVPGPGQYCQDISPLKKKSENTIFGKSLRDSPSRNVSPSPSEYESIDLNIFKMRQSNTIFGKSQRYRNYSIGTPGPSSYTQKIAWNNGVEFSLTGKSRNQIDFITPGPGQYELNINQIKIKNPCPHIGKSKRDSPDCKMYNTNLTPGTGDYSGIYAPILVTNPKHSFPKAKREYINMNIYNPGPADYNIPPTFADVPKYLMNNINNSIN